MKPFFTLSTLMVSCAGMTEGDVMTVDNAKSFVIPIESALKSMSKIEISAEDARKIRNGQEITLNNLCDLKNYDICYTIMGSLPNCNL